MIDQSSKRTMRLIPAGLTILFLSLPPFAEMARSALACQEQRPGRSIISNPTDPRSSSLVNWGNLDRNVISVQGQAFAQADRLTITQVPEQPYQAGYRVLTTQPIRRGDAITIRFKARAIGDQAVGAVHLERNAKPYTKSVSTQFVLGPEWETIEIGGMSNEDYQPGEAYIVFHLGYRDQTLDLGGLEALNLGQGLSLDEIPGGMRNSRYEGDQPDAPWRKRAQNRIEQHRKANLTLQVVDSTGQPIPDAGVELTLQRPDFGFGTAVSVPMYVRKSQDGEIYRQKIADLFNYVTLENGLKWPRWEEPQRKAEALQVIRELDAQGKRLRGHTLVWNPVSRVEELSGSQLVAEVRKHVQDVSSHPLLSRVIDDWDVQNEPFSNSRILDEIGVEGLVEMFAITKENCPDAQLFLNQFRVLSGRNFGDRGNAETYEKLTKDLLQRGVSVEGLGFQAHHGESLMPIPLVEEELLKFAKLGLEMQITEFDLGTGPAPSALEAIQANYARDYLTICFSIPEVTAFIMWGFWDGRHWRNNAPLFRQDWSLKPSGEAILDLIQNQWMTRATGRTDQRGQFTTRGFLGQYQATVDVGDSRERIEFSLEPGSNQVLIQVRSIPSGFSGTFSR